MLLLGLAGSGGGRFPFMLTPGDLGFNFTQDHLLVLLPHEQIFHFMTQGHAALLGLVALLQRLLQARSRSVDFDMPSFEADARLFMLLPEALLGDLSINTLLTQRFEFAGLLLSLDFQLVRLLLQGVDAISQESFLLLA